MEEKEIKKLKIAVVEDSRPYLKLISISLAQLESILDMEIDIDLFDNPIDYKITKNEYDIVVLDYVFRQYTYGANGFYLAKFTKEKHPNSFVIIHSSYAQEDIRGMIDEFKQYIDAYSHKESTSETKGRGLIEIIKRYVESSR